MLRRITASLAAAAALVGIAAGAANASTTSRHSDFYVRTTSGAFVPEDQLTAGQINALDNTCAPVVEAVLVDSLTQAQAPWGNVKIPVLGTVGGKLLIYVSDASAGQISAANGDQVGLTGLPSFLGPTSYSVVGYTSSGAPLYGC